MSDKKKACENIFFVSILKAKRTILNLISIKEKEGTTKLLKEVVSKRQNDGKRECFI